MGNHHTNSSYTTTSQDGTTTVVTTTTCQSSGSRRLDRKIARREAKAIRRPNNMRNLRKLDRLQRMKCMVNGCNCDGVHHQSQNIVQQQIVNPQQQIQYNNQPIIQPINNGGNNMIMCSYCQNAVNPNYYQSHIAQCLQTIPQGMPVYPGNQQFPSNQQQMYMGAPMNQNMGQGMMATCQFCYQQVSPQSLESHMSCCNYNPQFAKRY